MLTWVCRLHLLEAECPVCRVELEEAGEEKHLGRQVAIIAVSAVLMGAGFLLEHYYANSYILLPQRVYLQLLEYLSSTLSLPALAPWEPLMVKLPFAAAAATSGCQIVVAGVRDLVKGRRVTINLLVTVAIVGAFAIGHLEEGASVAILFMLVELLEEYAEGRVKGSVKKLMEAAPDVVTVLRDGEQVLMHAHSVGVGEVILVKPGEKIPLDGVVVEGETSVDQSSITGESVPVRKAVSDEVYAGTMNNEGYIKVKVTKPASETLYSKIVKIIEEAEKRRAPTERFVNKFSRYYTPLVILTAFLVAAVPPLVLGHPLTPWIYRALILLVVSCPCALAISTPVTMVSSITGAAREGVLVKGGAYVETLSRIKAFAFDKTGTLTEERLKVSRVIPLNSDGNLEDVLRVAASLEFFSEHPIAKAVVEEASRLGVTLGKVEEFTVIPGKGVAGKVDGVRYLVGNRKLFEGVTIPSIDGGTMVFVGSDSTLMGVIVLEDTIKDDAYYRVTELKRRGMKAVIMSGDNEKAVRTVAKELGVDEYYALRNS